MSYATPDGFPADAEQLVLQKKLERLTGALYQILRASPRGLSEHALLKKLQAPEWAVLEPVDFRDPARLYPVHFVLFHALYQLRGKLLKTSGESLSISALAIAIVPGRPSATKLPDRIDPLASFYLDLSNLHLSQDAIENMLDDFWRGVKRPQPEQLEAACAILSIDCPPDDLAVANQQFRRLAMAHHPDRGGDKQQLQQINQAIAIVRQHFR